MAADINFEDLAHDTWNYMIEQHKIHERKNGKAVPFYITVDALCENISFTRGQWRHVREAMISRAYPIKYVHPFGYTIGVDGDQASVAKHMWKAVEGLLKSMRSTIIEMCQSKYLPIDVKQYLGAHGLSAQDIVDGLKLHQLPPLPQPIEVALLTSGDDDSANTHDTPTER
jgi:hypothetical protein